MGYLREDSLLVVDKGPDEFGNSVILHPKNKKRKLLIDDINQVVYRTFGTNYLGEHLYDESPFPTTGQQLEVSFDEFCYRMGIRGLRGLSRLKYWFRYSYLLKTEEN